MTSTRTTHASPSSGVPTLPAAAAGLSARALAAVLNDRAVEATSAALAAAPGHLERPRLAPPDAPSPRTGPPAPPSLRAGIVAGAGTARLILFRVGTELFAAELALVEEVVEPDEVDPLPGMRGSMLGVVCVRDRAIPVYSPAAALGVPLAAPAAVLVARRGPQLVAVGVDAAEGVLEVRLDALRPPPFGDETVLALAWREGEIVSVVDWMPLVDACVAGHALEGA